MVSEAQKARGAQWDSSGNPFLPLRGKKDWSGKPGFLRLCRKKCAILIRKMRHTDREEVGTAAWP
jgi:hypothetical protein